MLSVSIFQINVNKMSNFNGSIFNSEIKNHSFKIFTLEIKWILYFFLAYLKILLVSLQSILKTKTFFKKKVSFEGIVEHGSVFSLLICASLCIDCLNFFYVKIISKNQPFWGKKQRSQPLVSIDFCLSLGSCLVCTSVGREVMPKCCSPASANRLKAQTSALTQGKSVRALAH